MADPEAKQPPRVALFITCLVDFLFPRVGEATVEVLEHFGVEVDFPQAQTCCGQPAFNAGHRPEARTAALHFLRVFEDAEAVVAPSASCVAMVVEHYVALFDDDAALARRFEALAAKTYELSQFLTEILGVESIPGRLEGSVAWHHSCHGLRGLGIGEGPQKLLRSIDGLEMRPLPGAEVCCGFGGLFAVKFPQLSTDMMGEKLDNFEASGAACLSATDCSCLMHLQGGLERRGRESRGLKGPGSGKTTRHWAEILADALTAPTQPTAGN